MTLPEPPRIVRPTLPPLIAVDAGANVDGQSFTEAQVTFTVETASAIGAEVSDCRIAALPSESLTSRRLRISESEVTNPQVTSWTSPRSHWRSALVSGGSIGVLDASGATLDAVAFRGVRLGYVNLREAHLIDVIFDGCRIGTLDVSGATTTRVALIDCLVDELDLRARKGEHLDLRGVDMVRLERLESANGLAGVVLGPDQVRTLAPTLAESLGIVVTEEDA